MKQSIRIAAATVAAALASGGIAAAPAQAEIVYQNNFDTENGGLTAHQYNSFNGLTVSRESVDLISGFNGFGIACAGTGGACVDMSGTIGLPNGQLTSGSYAFGAGETMTLAFMMSGNQRIVGGGNGFQSAFDFGNTLGVSWGYTRDGVTTDMGRWTGTGITYSNALNWDVPFFDFSIYFTPDTAGTATFSITADAANANVGAGPILDNVSLSIARQVSGAVPEPATWALMVLGFGTIGAAMRRRPVTHARATAVAC